VLDGMDDWNTRQHAASGLVERVRASRIDAPEAERATLSFLASHVAENLSPMCGNSICQDRRFLAREMPRLEAFFHYRNLDVSTLKILAGLWAPDVLTGVKKSAAHLAQEDIRDSINELRHYREHLLRIDRASA
jgi:oligoribonuclease